jgi:hypothetical protein
MQGSAALVNVVAAPDCAVIQLASKHALPACREEYDRYPPLFFLYLLEMGTRNMACIKE